MLFAIVFIVFMLIFSVMYRFGLPYSYMVFSFILSLFSVLVLYGKGRRARYLGYLLILILFLFLRIDYDLAAKFSFIPLADGYQDYAVSRIMMETGRYSIITSGPTTTDLSHASAWPLLHILASAFSMVTNINLLYVVLALPVVFSFIILMFVFLFIRDIATKFDLGERFILIALLIYTISPDNIYTEMQFVRQSFAMVFLIIVVYFLLFRFTVRIRLERAYTVLLLFSLLILVLAHDFTPFTLLLFLGVFYVLAYSLRRWTIRSGTLQFRWRSPFSLSLLFFICVALLTWWVFQATSIWTTQGYVLQDFLHPRLGIFSYTLESAQMRGGFYTILRPQLYMYALNVRDLAIYLPLAIALSVFLIRTLQRRRTSTHDFYLACSTLAFLIILVYYEFVLQLQPLRLIWLGAPIVAYFAASFYEYLFSKKKILIHLATSALIILIVFPSFLSPWTHLYVPTFLYDPSTKFEDVGSHSTGYWTIIPFAKNYVDYKNIDAALSDDPFLMYLALPTESYAKIEDLHINLNANLNNTERTAIFEFSNLNPSYYLINVISEKNGEVLENINGFKQQIMVRYSQVYSSGSSCMLVSSDP